MKTTKGTKPKFSLNDNDTMPANRQSSLLLVFLRSAKYEGKYLLNHSWDYLLLLWLPLLTILAIWWTFSKPYIVDLPIGVIDNSHSSYSRTLTRYLEASPDLTVQQIFLNAAEAKNAIVDNQVYGVVIIPSDFATSVNKGLPSPVVLKVNAQYGTHSGIIQRGVQTVVGTVSAGVEIQRTIKQGSDSDQARISYSPIGIERISLFNIGTNYQQFLASTVIPALLHILAMIIGATTIGREIRDRTLSVWYHNMVFKDMPYPDFGTLKHFPPEQKLTHYHADILTNIDSYRQPSVDTELLSTSHYTYVPYKPDSLNTLNLNTDSLKTGSLKSDSLKSDGFIPSKFQRPSYAVRNLVNDPIKLNKPYMPDKVSILKLIVGLNGKLIWALLFYMLWGGLMLVLALTVHNASGLSLLVVYVSYVALIMISLWLGAIFTLLTYSLRMGLSSAAFISAPSYAFAGVGFPLIAMSEGAQRWANALPLTHYMKVHISQLQMLAPSSVAYSKMFGLITVVIVTLVITALLCVRAFKNPDRWGAR